MPTNGEMHVSGSSFSAVFDLRQGAQLMSLAIAVLETEAIADTAIGHDIRIDDKTTAKRLSVLDAGMRRASIPDHKVGLGDCEIAPSASGSTPKTGAGFVPASWHALRERAPTWPLGLSRHRTARSNSPS